MEVARYKPNISSVGQILEKYLIWQKMSSYEYFSLFKKVSILVLCPT